MTAPQPAPFPTPPAPQQPAGRPSAEPPMVYTVVAPVHPRPGAPNGPQLGPGFGARPGPVPHGVPQAWRNPAPAVEQQIVRVLFAGLGLVGVALGVSLPGPGGIGWSTATAWSIFGTVCGLIGLIAATLTSSQQSWHLQAGAAAGVLLFWLIAARPVAASDIGFLATIGTVGTCAAAWLHPARPRRAPSPR